MRMSDFVMVTGKRALLTPDSAATKALGYIPSGNSPYKGRHLC